MQYQQFWMRVGQTFSLMYVGQDGLAKEAQTFRVISLASCLDAITRKSNDVKEESVGKRLNCLTVKHFHTHKEASTSNILEGLGGTEDFSGINLWSKEHHHITLVYLQ